MLDRHPGRRCLAGFAVQQAAVVSDEGKLFVFKHWREDFLARQDVRKRREFSGMVEILEGRQLEPLITDDFLLIPNPRKCDPKRPYRVVFRAAPVE